MLYIQLPRTDNLLYTMYHHIVHHPVIDKKIELLILETGRQTAMKTEMTDMITVMIPGMTDMITVMMSGMTGRIMQTTIRDNLI